MSSRVSVILALGDRTKAGRRAAAHDLTFDPRMDILSDLGFCAALYGVLSVQVAGSLTLAPVCSTWVYMHLDSGIKGAKCSGNFPLDSTCFISLSPQPPLLPEQTGGLCLKGALERLGGPSAGPLEQTPAPLTKAMSWLPGWQSCCGLLRPGA